MSTVGGLPLGRFDGLALGQASCAPPSPMVRGEIRGTFVGGELWGLVFAPALEVGKEIKIVWRMTGTGELVVSARAPSGGIVEAHWGPDAHTGSNWIRPGDEWGTGFVFTEAGCWHLRLARSDATGDVWLQVSA